MFNEFIKFDKMITPQIIKIVWWVTSAISILVGLITMFSGFSPYTGSGIQVFLGLIIIVAGPFICRIYCELLIVFFKIHESLQDIRKEKKEQNQSAS